MHRMWLACASAFSVFAFCTGIFTVSAQENRQYWYDSIDTQITVNADSTLSVEERQTYHYQGEYHQGWRSILLKDISYISDIEVYDGATGKKLQWSSSKRDKTDSSNWGYYTTYKKDGAQVIEWYYNLRDTSHLWILRYRVHGAITFGTQFDRLYYNIFTDYNVPVHFASASIVLPQGLSHKDALYGYRSGGGRLLNRDLVHTKETDIYTVYAWDFGPRQDFTIDFSWQKGYVSQSAFWRDWFTHYYGYVLGSIIVLLSILYWIIFFVRTEVLPKGRGTIIPQYEPPRGLRPALVELLMKEMVSTTAWSATVVDLAVRGYVDIEEKEKTWFFSQTAYEVRKKRNYTTDPTLEAYEQSFLTTLFSLNNEDVFRTNDLTSMHFNTIKYVKFEEKMRELPDLVKERADQETWYEVNFAKEEKKHLIGKLIIIIAAIVTLFLFSSFAQILALVASLAVFYAVFHFFAPFEARLSQEGRELLEELLGFKLYMETAERYRLQNLTPDLFEKYLPYAMIFGIEKKWSKTFDGMQVSPPSWYHGALVAGSMGNGVPDAGFSASAFSSSFSSSFANAFSSSAGSGASGGGGAGGGGGGGGGGAS